MNSFSQSIPNNMPKQPYIRSTFFDNINYNYVTSDQRFTSQRCINPLDPNYDVKYYGGENYYYGEIEGSKPASFSRYLINNNYNLKTSDIEGTQPGTKNKYSNYKHRNSLSLSREDIIGSKAGSRLKGIVTKRQTNPLNPQYEYLGWSESKNYYKGKYNEYGNRLKLDVIRNNSNNASISKPVFKYEKENNFNFTIPSEKKSNKQYCNYPNNENYLYDNEQYLRNNILNDKNRDTNYFIPPLNYQRKHHQYLFPPFKQ